MMMVLVRCAALLSLADADRVDDLVVVPWAHAVLVCTELCAAAAQEIRQVVGVDDLEQILLVGAALDGDLLAGLLIEEALDHGPHTREKHGCVDDESLSHDLRVVVAADLGGQLDQRIDLLRENFHGAAVQVEDVQALLDAGARDG